MKIQAYKTIKIPTEFTVKEKKSVFLAKTFPVSDEGNVDSILTDMKKKYYDASHRCYAYRLLSGKSKFSDAGEPSGTAGIRILNAIDHYQLQNCLVVVIRYFGGIKLGVGPLGKAYYVSAINALSKGERILRQPCNKVQLQVDIAALDKITSFLLSNKIKITKTEYEPNVSIHFLIPVDMYPNLQSKINKTFKGSVKFLQENEIIFD